MKSLDRNFVEWFYEEVYAEPNHNRNGWMYNYMDFENPDHRNFWMREAFLAGATAQTKRIQELLLQQPAHEFSRNYQSAHDLIQLVATKENVI